VSPRVSVVIPAYNNELYIEETVRSVLAQTFTDFELLIADHSSADGTWDRLQQFAEDPRVTLMTTAAGGSAERNWNRVTREATGELLKLVCGDDLLAPDMLEKQVAAFDAHDDGVVMVASSRDVVDASGRVVVRNLGLGGLQRRIPGSEAVRRSVLRGSNIYGEPCCVMVRRAALEKVGLWHGNPGYNIDQATYLRVLLVGDFVPVPEPLAAFRISATQWSVTLVDEQARSTAEMHRQLREMVPDLLSRRDVRIGNALAYLRAVQRRLFYLYLGRRMTPEPVPTTQA
jgi:glycosyltransferase involved in cell wall biosynthesis